jgi:hypothetical protein
LGRIRDHVPVKLIAGLLGSHEELFASSIRALEERYGETDYISPFTAFSFTSYYEKEMGNPLMKRFYSFRELIDPSLLPEIKLFTNEIEERHSRVEEGRMKRSINIDPGYVALSKLVLASTKDRSHRIYVGKRIYAEITLQFKKKTFVPLYSTYPDYRSEEYISILNVIRENYMQQLKTIHAEITLPPSASPHQAPRIMTGDVECNH